MERAVRLIARLCAAHARVSFEDLEEPDWGSYSNLMKFLTQLNSAWSFHRGIPLFQEVNEDGLPWQRGQPRYLQLADRSLKYTASENLAVMPAYLQFMKLLKGTFLEKGFQQLLAAGQSEMDGKERAALRATERKFYFTGKGTKDYSRHSQAIEAIYKALLSEKMIEVTRRSNSTGSIVQETLKPLTLVMFNHGLYLVTMLADDPNPKPVKHQIEKFQSVKVTTRAFTYPALYKPEQLFAKSFGMHNGDNGVEYVVELQILDVRVGQYLKERRWSHADEYFERDGHPCLRLRTNSLVEVKSWVMGFGSTLKVLGPGELRNQIEDEVRRMASMLSA